MITSTSQHYSHLETQTQKAVKKILTVARLTVTMTVATAQESDNHHRHRSSLTVIILLIIIILIIIIIVIVIHRLTTPKSLNIIPTFILQTLIVQL